MPTWLIVALAVAYTLAGLPLVCRAGPRWPLWLNVVVTIAFLPSFVVAAGAVAVAVLVRDWSFTNQ